MWEPIPKRDILTRRIPLLETQTYSFKQSLMFMKKSVKELYIVQFKPFCRLQNLGIEIVALRMKNLAKIASALDVGVYELFTYLKEQEELTEESNLKDIISLLRERDSKDIEMVRNILNEIFRRIDGNS